MKKLKKYNEFFDTEEFKIQHDIEILSNTLNPTNIINKFDKQEQYMPLLNHLTYKYPFFGEVANATPYTKLTQGQDGTYFFNFKNEQCDLVIGINKKGKNLYKFSITYIPSNITNLKTNYITVYQELLDIRYDSAVSQIFDNITLDNIYNKIDRILIPIMKEFRFDYLLNIKQSEYNIRKN